MIPDFDDNGYLPAGLHAATIEEVDARFGRESEVREAQLMSLRWLLDLARRAGVRRIMVNGSFVTDILEPNDVDCALLIEPGFPLDSDAEAELISGLPFLSLQLVEQEEFDWLVAHYFASDRRGVPKGMVELLA